jgi:hypothetical protein
MHQDTTETSGQSVQAKNINSNVTDVDVFWSSPWCSILWQISQALL